MSCGIGEGKDLSNAAVITKDKDGGPLLASIGNKKFPNGLTIAAQFFRKSVDRSGGGVVGLGSTDGNSHLYVRTSYSCDDQKGLAIGADNGSDNWSCTSGPTIQNHEW